jgi:cell cycle sensor histidine kinase DivJ
VGILTPLRHYIDSLVHPTAQCDALTAARHRAFIAPRLLGSFVALAAFPLYLSLRGVPSMLEVLVFGWLIAPILIAYFLSRTGRYESAHLLSSLALSGLVAVVAFETGGIGSFAAIWLVVVPLEAALSASRRVVALASAFALGAAGFLLAAGWLEFVPALDAGSRGALAALGIISASLYATGLALGAESLARTSLALLNAEEDRYRLLARNMTDVITRHGRNGAVLFVSPAAEPMFGVAVTELHGHGLFDRVHVADRPAYLTALADAASQDEARSVEFRVRFEAPTGAVNFLWLEMRCRPLDRSTNDGQESEAREVVAVLRDVTERKAQEIELDLARQEADRANAAKTRFLATMSHELRTPLNVIIGFSEMLVNEDTMRIDAKRRVEYAQLINDSGHHLLSVVNGILDMSKIENGNFEITPEPFAPGQVVDICCELLALKAREGGIDLLAKIDKGLPDVVADKRAMTQIMLNLMSNALKFTPPGGKVTVGVRIEGPHLVYSVNDTGVGISAEDLPRLGEPFFQARGSYDRRHDGTGLGLSIVKGLLTLHGGDLQIHSRPGEGTRISVKLPLDCESARRAQAAAAAAVVIAEQAKPAMVTAKIFQSNQLQVKKSA